MRTTSSDHGALPSETSIGAGAPILSFSYHSADRQSDVPLNDFADSWAEHRNPPLHVDEVLLHPRPDKLDGQYTHVERFEKTRRPSLLPHPSTIVCHTSSSKGDEAPSTSSVPAKAAPVAWSDLPNRKQLAILTIARLSEPLTQTSLQAYMFYQLRSFDPNLPDSTISSQAGMLQGSFTAAQFLTAVLWGRIADSDSFGRKRVLLIGLVGTCISCIGFGFSRSFMQAAVFRTLGGALNGNVGVMRTMISEIIKEKKFQSRAFLLLPMCFNIGVIVGPILGGLLSNPVVSYPKVFGANSLLGGKEGVWWLNYWPYALPNMISAVFLFISAMGVILGLEETLESRRDRPDLGLNFGRAIANTVRRTFCFRSHKYTAISTVDTYSSNTSSPRSDSYELESRLPTQISTPTDIKSRLKTKTKLPFSRIWTRNVLSILICHAILALHVGTFNNLWFIHLSTPRFDLSNLTPPSRQYQHLPFAFTGGLGMPPRSVGFAMAVLGIIGITLQLLVYPKVNAKLGTTRSFRYSLCLFPLAYTLAPYLSIIPSSTSPPAQASGILVWLSIALVLLIHVIARTFALPAATILINNCSPHPSVLGTIHGIMQSVSSASRTVGPVLGGWGYGKGLEVGVVGMVWWCLAGVAVCGWAVSSAVREGDGHEILLEGEETEGGEGKVEAKRQ